MHRLTSRDKTQSWPLDKYSDTRFFGFLIIFSLVVTLSRIEFSLEEDMGIFITVSSLLNRGYRLYQDVTDIKDPLFFYSIAIVIKAFGLKAAFMLDAVWVTVSAIFGFKLLREYKFPKYICLLSSVIFILTLTGVNYDVLRTQLPAICLLLIGLYLFLKQNYTFSGAFFALMILYKLPFAIFILMPIIIICLNGEKFKKRMRLIAFGLAGFVSTLFSVWTIMLIRGEFQGYLEMIQENFHYASVYQTVVGQADGVLGHIIVWNKNSLGIIPTGCFILYLAIKIFTEKNSKDSEFYLFSLLLTCCTTAFLLSTALWPHHLQVLSVINVVALPAIITRRLKTKTTPKRKILQLESRGIKRFLGKSSKVVSIVFLLLVVIANGFSLSKVDFAHFKNHQFNQNPTEIAILSGISNAKSSEFSFARLGANDDSGYGAFLNPNARFTCKRTAITGGETVDIIHNYLKCIKEVPDYLVVSPAFNGLSNRKGVYQDYFMEANKIFTSNFFCFDFQNTAYRYCIRKNIYVTGMKI